MGFMTRWFCSPDGNLGPIECEWASGVCGAVVGELPLHGVGVDSSSVLYIISRDRRSICWGGVAPLGVMKFHGGSHDGSLVDCTV